MRKGQNLILSCFFHSIIFVESFSLDFFLGGAGGADCQNTHWGFFAKCF